MSKNKNNQNKPAVVQGADLAAPGTKDESVTQTVTPPATEPTPPPAPSQDDTPAAPIIDAAPPAIEPPPPAPNREIPADEDKPLPLPKKPTLVKDEGYSRDRYRCKDFAQTLVARKVLHPFYIETPDGKQFGPEGGWIVKATDGARYILPSDEEFNKHFQKVNQ